MLYLKTFNNHAELKKSFKKLIDKIDYIKDKEIEVKKIEDITAIYYYYDYIDKKGKYKELSIMTLNNGSSYYMIYKNKGVNAGSLLYNLYKVDYIKAFKFNKEFYNVNYRHKILNYKVLNVDIDLGNNTDIKRNFTALKNIEKLKYMCIEENNKAI